jgi:hypothetical protein
MQTTRGKTPKLRRYLILSGIYAAGAIAFSWRALETSGSGNSAVTIAYSIAAAGFATFSVVFLLSARAARA